MKIVPSFCALNIQTTLYWRYKSYAEQKKRKCKTFKKGRNRAFKKIKNFKKKKI